MPIFNATGGAHNAICSHCGASLTYPVTVRVNETDVVLGRDCAEKLFGFRIERGVEVLDLYEIRKAWEEKQTLQEAERAERERVCAAIAELNGLVISELSPFAQWTDSSQSCPINFAAGIIRDLRNGVMAEELSKRAKQILADVVATGAGRRGSKAYKTARGRMEVLLGMNQEMED